MRLLRAQSCSRRHYTVVLRHAQVQLRYCCFDHNTHNKFFTLAFRVKMANTMYVRIIIHIEETAVAH